MTPDASEEDNSDLLIYKGEFKHYTDILINNQVLSASDVLTPERILELFHEFIYKNYSEAVRAKKMNKD